MKKQVTSKIRKLREQRGVSQENVADELGITHSAYSKIERGETDPNLGRLFALAKILNVDITEFFNEDLPALKEPQENYGNIKMDIEKLNQLIQTLLGEMSALRAALSDQKPALRNKKTKKD